MKLIEIGETGDLSDQISLDDHLNAIVVEATVDHYRRTGFARAWIGYVAVKEDVPVGACGFKSSPVNGRVEIAYGTFSGITPSAGASAYCASKAAVRMFTKTVAIECADAGTRIRVNVVTPGGVKTPVWENEDFFKELVAEHSSTEEAFVAMAGDVPSHQFFTPEEVAETILYLASDESSQLAGVEIVLDRGHTG